MENARDLLTMTPVVPVLEIPDESMAVPLAQALLDGGVSVLEVTLRTPAGLPSIRAIADALPDVVVGVGTVTNASEFSAAVDAGSRFVVSPGLTPALLETADQHDVPIIPGVATSGEIMTALEFGLDTLKFFPAEVNGGVAALRAFAGPFPGINFCPTGGVGLHNIEDYLALSSVVTVGGTWLTPANLVRARDWSCITDLASEASTRVRAIRADQ